MLRKPVQGCVLGRLVLGQRQQQPAADGHGLGTARTRAQVVGEQVRTQRARARKLDQQRGIARLERQHKPLGLLYDATRRGARGALGDVGLARRRLRHGGGIFQSCGF